MSGIQLVWNDDTHTCYRVEMGLGWTWAQFKDAFDQAHAVIAEQEHDVNIIMWFKATIPPGKAAESLTYAGGTQPPNLRHTVIINESSTRLLDILVKNEDRKQGWHGPKIVQSLDDALAYLQTLD